MTLVLMADVVEAVTVRPVPAGSALCLNSPDLAE